MVARKPKRLAETKFFKVLVDDFKKKLRIPPLFVRVFERIMPKKPILKSEQGNFPVSVKSNDNGYFIKRGWKKFVKNHELQMGDFLVFNLLDDNKTFEVDMYGPTCCLKGLKLPFHEKSSCRDWEANVTPNKDIAFKKKGRPKSGRRKKPQVSARKAGLNAKRGPNVQENNEMNERERVAKEIRAMEPNHPSFKQDLKDYQKYGLVMRKRFVYETGLESKRNTVIKDPQGRVYTVDISVTGRQVRLSTGWSIFYKANGLATGDTCVFHFIPEKSNLIEVQIHRKRRQRC
ncbi:hypothetical protein P3X46_018853 [Hevea brasiliensis]|uniref:TF-B3 domain-containing protein n=1 Tax=Hevea brasiliensis TaxID=3981 RepID=A0ABQ9LTW3_HEVBR|nr:putative B3 domain-containing protein Os03g0621600 [Hevea brasiliensis]KAJ9170773.1 hypothetical protein P3X46_018853 [Hevea brasiliensis]